ncbi:MAG: type II toxin-antitoxin system VapC family toxin [archaeon]
MEKLYIDTNVYVSYLEGEFGGITKNLGLYSEQLFKRAFSCEFVIVASEMVVKELLGVIDDKNAVSEIFAELHKAGKLEWVFETEKMARDANRIAALYASHPSDALHSLLAKKAGVPLITWNIKDFANLNLAVYSPASI